MSDDDIATDQDMAERVSATCDTDAEIAKRKLQEWEAWCQQSSSRAAKETIEDVRALLPHTILCDEEAEKIRVHYRKWEGRWMLGVLHPDVDEARERYRKDYLKKNRAADAVPRLRAEL